MSKRNINFLIGATLTLIGFLFGYIQKSPESLQIKQTPAPSATPKAAPATEKVIKVVDGDTIELTGGVKVRYIGMDTPETVDPRRPVGCFGHEASDKNKELVLGREVRLEKDVSETDKYGRLLRYVYVGDTMINNELVREGYARVLTYPPDVKYQEMFLDSQKYARENNLGLWSKCL